MRTTTGRMTLFVVLVALAACVAASSVQASTGVRYGIQDDAWLEFGPGSTLNQRAATFKRLGVPLVRFTLRWNEIARRRPKQPTSPRDRAYDWRRPDRVLRALRRNGLTPVLTLVGTPAWANGGRPPKFAPPRPRDFRRFATAAARRYPWVRYWVIWNEPNKRLWLRPTKSAIYVRHLLNPAYEGIHAVLPHARVAGGATGPQGAQREASHPSPGCAAWPPPARSSTRTPTTPTPRRRPRRRPAAAARTAPGSRWRRSGSS